MKEQGVKFEYLVGTMIEIPRGALTADEIATVAEFFSFGTNDLTQTTLGRQPRRRRPVPRPYVEMEIYAKDPFESSTATASASSCGWPWRRAARRGRGSSSASAASTAASRRSIEFCHLIGLNYVSCSPFRVPIARLAAARAALLNPPAPRRPVGKAVRQPARKPKKASRRR